MKVYKKSQLQNGLTIITAQDDSAEIVDIDIVIRAGARHETKDQRGYAHVLEHMLVKGSKKYPTLEEVALFTERSGIYFNAFTSLEKIWLRTQTVENKALETLEFLCDVCLYPMLDDTVLENEKKVITQEIKRSYDDNSKRLWIESIKRVFAGSTLSNDPLGEEESVMKATAQALQEYHKAFFTPDKIAVIAVGAITHERIEEVVKRWFGEISRGVVAAQLTNQEGKIGEDFLSADSQQSYIQISFNGVKPTEDEAMALDMIASFLGKGRTSLLNQELRQKKGIVYGIGASAIEYSDAHLFSITTSTTQPREVIDGVLEKIRNFELYFTRELCVEYQEQMINIAMRKFGNPSSIVGFLGSLWFLYDRVEDPKEAIQKIRGLKYEDILIARKKFINEDRALIMQLGKEKQ